MGAGAEAGAGGETGAGVGVVLRSGQGRRTARQRLAAASPGRPDSGTERGPAQAPGPGTRRAQRSGPEWKCIIGHGRPICSVVGDAIVHPPEVL